MKINVWSEERGLKSLKEGVSLEKYQEKYPSAVQIKKAKSPSIARLNRLASASIVPAADGCSVEPDGVCEHGQPSLLLLHGYI